MSQLGHTPGPWEWWTSNSWRRLVHSVGGKQIPVITPFVARDGHADLQVGAENMPVIAAAPKMLAALRLVAGELAPNVRPYSTDSYLPAHIVDAVLAAISEAETLT